MKSSAGTVILLSIVLPSSLVAQPEPIDLEALMVAPTLSFGSPPPPRTVEPPDSYALSIDGAFDLGGYVFKDGLPFLHNDGGPNKSNTALGVNALISATPGDPTVFSGSRNTALGAFALELNTSASQNTAIGASALAFNTTGYNNTASGALVMLFNTSGSSNTASGVATLFLNTTGSRNTANGYNALFSNTTGARNTAMGVFALLENTTGSRNIAIGYLAGHRAKTGDDNIFLGNPGVEADSGRIRLGYESVHTATYIAGISGQSVDPSTAAPVRVDATGKLGTTRSSRRYKDEIEDMGAASRGLMDLRPVTFHYREPGSNGPRPRQFGLIAEEVAEVFPELVVLRDGRPETVRYELLSSILLNEVQQQRRRLEDLEARLSELADPAPPRAGRSGEVNQ